MSSARIKLRSLSQQNVAEVFDVSTRQVRNWNAEGCPRNRDGTYSLGAVVAWLCGDRGRCIGRSWCWRGPR